MKVSVRSCKVTRPYRGLTKFFKLGFRHPNRRLHTTPSLPIHPLMTSTLSLPDLDDSIPDLDDDVFPPSNQPMNRTTLLEETSSDPHPQDKKPAAKKDKGAKWYKDEDKQLAVSYIFVSENSIQTFFGLSWGRLGLSESSKRMSIGLMALSLSAAAACWRRRKLYEEVDMVQWKETFVDVEVREGGFSDGFFFW